MKRLYDSPAERPDPRTPVQISPDIYERMRQAAHREARSITSMVNRALWEWLEEREAA